MGLKNEGLNSQENKQRQLSKFQRNKIFLSVSRYVAKSSRLLETNILDDICDVMRCAIWYHLYNLKNIKNTHGGALILVKLQAKTCNFNKINSAPWVFFTFFKLYKWYQIAQRITYFN